MIQKKADVLFCLLSYCLGVDHQLALPSAFHPGTPSCLSAAILSNVQNSMYFMGMQSKAVDERSTA